MKPNKIKRLVFYRSSYYSDFFISYREGFDLILCKNEILKILNKRNCRIFYIYYSLEKFKNSEKVTINKDRNKAIFIMYRNKEYHFNPSTEKFLTNLNRRYIWIKIVANVKRLDKQPKIAKL